MIDRTIAVIPQTVNGQAVLTVNARQIHTILEIKKDFSDWMKNQIERCRFLEGKDYIVETFDSNNPPRRGTDYGKAKIDYHITVSMAEHIGMISNTEKGFEVREYFRDMRDKAKAREETPERMPKISGKFLSELAEYVLQVETKCNSLAERVFGLECERNAITKTDKSLSLTATAKIYTMNPSTLVEILLEKQALRKRDKLPMQKHIDAGRLVAAESRHETPDGTITINIVTRVTGKGVRYFYKKLKQWKILEAAYQLRFEKMFSPLP